MKEKLIRQGSSCSFLENYTLSLYTVYNKQGTLCTAGNMQWFGCRNVNVISATSEFCEVGSHKDEKSNYLMLT